MTAPKNEKAKLDLFGSFKKLNAFDFDFWENLSSDEKKQASPYVFLMWMQNSNNDAQVMYLNEFVNPYLFNSLKDNNDLAFTMLALSTRKKQNRYQWVKRPSIKSATAKLTNVKAVLKEYFEESEKNIQYYLDRVTIEEFVSICKMQGRQDDEIKKLKKEFESSKVS